MEHDKVALQAYIDTKFEGRVKRNMLELWPELRLAVPDGILEGKVITFPSGSIVIENGDIVVK
jgi:hypothetical protein